MFAQESPTITEPKVILFDVNETLLDLKGLQASVGKALGGREDLLPLWFSTMLHHSLVDSATERYHNFGDIGVAALMMVAQNNGVELSEADARNAIVTPLRSLPKHLGALGDTHKPESILPSLTLINFEHFCIIGSGYLLLFQRGSIWGHPQSEHLGTPTK